MNVTSPVTETNSNQPDLISVPANRTKPDPREKPSWEQWAGMDVFRRLLNDDVINQNKELGDKAFKLWHWYHNCKDKDGKTRGFRAQAWYIARKFYTTRDTVYAANYLLKSRNFLAWESAPGNQPIIQVKQGILDVQSGAIPLELPFKVPASCPPKQTSAVSQNRSSCPPKQTSAVAYEMQPICDSSVISVKEGCEANPPLVSSLREGARRRELWQAQKEYDKIVEIIREISREEKTPANLERLRGLKRERDRLKDEIAGVDTSKISEPQKPQRQLATQPQGPMATEAFLEAWKVRTVSVIEEGKNGDL